jgi:hypothetical protein
VAGDNHGGADHGRVDGQRISVSTYIRASGRSTSNSDCAPAADLAKSTTIQFIR